MPKRGRSFSMAVGRLSEPLSFGSLTHNRDYGKFIEVLLKLMRDISRIDKSRFVGYLEIRCIWPDVILDAQVISLRRGALAPDRKLQHGDGAGRHDGQHFVSVLGSQGWGEIDPRGGRRNEDPGGRLERICLGIPMSKVSGGGSETASAGSRSLIMTAARPSIDSHLRLLVGLLRPSP
jgi:hypothetical protein